MPRPAPSGPSTAWARASSCAGCACASPAATTSPTPSSACRPGQAIVEGHGTADAIEAAVRDALPDTDVVVHLEPRRDGLDLRDRALAAALAEPLVREAHDITIYEHDGQVSVSLHLKLAPGRRASARRTTSPSGSRRPCARSRASTTCRRIWSRSRSPSPPAPTRTRATPDEAQRRRISELARARTGQPPRELRLLHADGGLVVFVSVAVPAGMTLPDAHELASRLEDEIRAGQPHMQDVVVHTEP